VTDSATIDRIINFARWARTPRGAVATCYSAEGRYRPERLREGEEAERRTAPHPVDVRDALAVWRAINPTRGFPVRWYLAISARFILGLHGWQFAGYMRRHRVPVSRSDAEHDRLIAQALAAARVALERQTVAFATQQRYTVPSVDQDAGAHPLERVAASDQ
jgi:hypothetical protein